MASLWHTFNSFFCENSVKWKFLAPKTFTIDAVQNTSAFNYTIVTKYSCVKSSDEHSQRKKTVNELVVFIFRPSPARTRTSARFPFHFQLRYSTINYFCRKFLRATISQKQQNFTKSFLFSDLFCALVRSSRKFIILLFSVKCLLFCCSFFIPDMIKLTAF